MNNWACLFCRMTGFTLAQAAPLAEKQAGGYSKVYFKV
jgi:hypothetical protein